MTETRNPAPLAAGRVSKTFNCCAALNASRDSSPSLHLQAYRLAARLWPAGCAAMNYLTPLPPLPNSPRGQRLRYIVQRLHDQGPSRAPSMAEDAAMVGRRAALRTSITGRPLHRFRPTATRSWPSREFHNWPAAPTIGQLSAPSTLAIWGRRRRSGSVADTVRRMHRASECLRRGALLEGLCVDRAIAKEDPRFRRSRLTHYLTDALPEHLERQIYAPVSGMAFLSGIGSIGTACADRLDFDRSNGRRRRGSFEARCLMFSRLSQGALGPRVPCQTPSCKYFEAAPAAARPTQQASPR
jgi:hypothetical protein